MNVSQQNAVKERREISDRAKDRINSDRARDSRDSRDSRDTSDRIKDSNTNDKQLLSPNNSIVIIDFSLRLLCHPCSHLVLLRTLFKLLRYTIVDVA